MSNTHLKVAATVSIGVFLIPGGFVLSEDKIVALAETGIDGIDLYLWDLVPYTEQILNCKLSVEGFWDFNFTEADWKLLYEGAGRVNTLCVSHGLKVVSLIGLLRLRAGQKEANKP
jgi:hypothetical protein